MRSGGSSPTAAALSNSSASHQLIFSTKSFFAGVLLSLLACSVSVWLQLRAEESSLAHATGHGGSVWKDRQLDKLQWAYTRPVTQAGVSQLALKPATDIDSGYSRRNTMIRFAQSEEVERINSRSTETEAKLRKQDTLSWQARMAEARASDERNSAGGPSQSMRARASRDSSGWNENAAVALRRAEKKRRRTSTHMPRARPHPLVGSTGHAYYSQRALIVYDFLPTDNEALENLEFFIETAIRAHHQADYVIVIQQHALRPVDHSKLPKLPANARYIHYKSSDDTRRTSSSSSTADGGLCAGLGTLGWLLDLQHPRDDKTAAVVDSTKHTMFIAFGHYGWIMQIDSSMRGPWFPAWIDLNDPARVWFAAYQFHLEKHTPEMKLVGSTISCQYKQPHVQLGAWMVDSVGWGIIDANRTALLKCVPPSHSLATQSMSLSSAMLSAGFNIGSQMLAFQEIDFRVKEDNSAQTCLGMNSGDPQYDELRGVELSEGHYMDPYEILFVKYTSDFKHYKSETFSDWKRWEKERWEANANSDTYYKRWTEQDFRNEEAIKSREEEARLAVIHN